MPLIDVDALRERWNVSERCEDCKQDARYCGGSLYGSELYSLRDICASIDDAPIIDAIPVEWMREKMRGYASSLKSTETAALVMVMQMWQKEQEAKE